MQYEPDMGQNNKTTKPAKITYPYHGKNVLSLSVNRIK